MNQRRVRVGTAGLLLGLLLAGVLAGLMHSRRRVVEVPILMYHRIGDGVDSAWWVTPHDFEGHLQALREQGYKSILPSDLVAHQKWGWPLPVKPVILTFDDGYLNILENAEPLLERYGFCGVSYLITGAVGASPETRKSNEGTPVLVWPEIRAMQERGVISFGGHSRSHANLRAMADPAGEIAGCYRDIRKQGGFEPEGFCYPFGQFKEATRQAVIRGHFTSAMSCVDGTAMTGKGLDLLALPRVPVMGGLHRYRAETTVAEGRITVRLLKEGREMEVNPRLVWKTSTGGTAAVWLPPVTVTAAPVVVQADDPARQGGLDPALELWDNYRVVRYWRQALVSAGSAK